MNELINCGGDCRTAPATPGLLTSMTVCKYDTNDPNVKEATVQQGFEYG